MAVTTFKYKPSVTIEPVEIKTPSYSFLSDKTTLNLDIFNTPISNPLNKKDSQYPSYGYIIATRTKNVKKGNYLELLISAFPVVTFLDLTSNIDSMGDPNEYFVLAIFTNEKITLKAGEGDTTFVDPVINDPIEIFNNLKYEIDMNTGDYSLSKRIVTTILKEDKTGLKKLPDNFTIGDFEIIGPEGRYISDMMYLSKVEFDLVFQNNSWTKEINGEMIIGTVTEVTLCLVRYLPNVYEKDGISYYPLSYTYHMVVHYGNGIFENALVTSEEDSKKYQYDTMPFMKVYRDGLVETYFSDMDYITLFSERLDAILSKAPNDGYGTVIEVNVTDGVTIQNPIEINKLAFITPYATYQIKSPLSLDIKSYFKVYTKTVNDVVVRGVAGMLLYAVARNPSGELELVIFPYLMYEDKSTNQDEMMSVMYDMSSGKMTPKDIQVILYIQANVGMDFIYKDSYFVSIPVKTKIPVQHIPLNNLKIQGNNSISLISHTGTKTPVFMDGLSFKDFMVKKTNEPRQVTFRNMWGEETIYQMASAINLSSEFNSNMYSQNNQPYGDGILSYIEEFDLMVLRMFFSPDTDEWKNYINDNNGYYTDNSDVEIKAHIPYFRSDKTSYYYNSYTGKAHSFGVKYRIYLSKPESYLYDNPETNMFLSYILTDSISNVKSGDSRTEMLDFTLCRLDDLAVKNESVRAPLFNNPNQEVVCSYYLNVSFYTDSVINEIKNGTVLYQRKYDSKDFAVNGDQRLALTKINGYDVFPFMEVKSNVVKHLTPNYINMQNYFWRNPYFYYGVIIKDYVDHSVVIETNKQNNILPNVKVNLDGFTFSLSPKSSIPKGLSIDPSTGAIIGIPTTFIFNDITVIATNGVFEYSTTFTATYNDLAMPSIEYPMQNYFQVDSMFTLLPKVSGTGASINMWSLLGNVPNGISLNSKNGEISGIINDAGVYSVSVKAENYTGGIFTTEVYLRFEFQANGYSEKIYKEGMTLNGYSSGFTLLLGGENKFGQLSPLVYKNVNIKGVFLFKRDLGISNYYLQSNIDEGVMIVLEGDTNILYEGGGIILNDIYLSRYDKYFWRYVENGHTILRFAPIPLSAFSSGSLRLKVI